MNELILSKTDIKKILFAVVALSMCCFIVGYFSANSGNSNLIEKIVHLESTVAALKNIDKNNSDTKKHRKQIATSTVSVNDKNNDESIILHARKAYGIQAGVFQKYDNAKSLHMNLLGMGIENQILVRQASAAESYRIVIRQFSNKNEALESLKTLRRSYNMRLSLVSLDNKTPETFAMN